MFLQRWPRREASSFKVLSSSGAQLETFSAFGVGHFQFKNSRRWFDCDIFFLNRETDEQRVMFFFS